MTALYHAHSGLRYLVLVAGFVSILVFAFGLATKRPLPASRGIMTAFTGLLDLQILLGIALIVAGIWYGALMGHVTMMILAAVAAHGAGIAAKKAPDERRALGMRLGGVVAALVLIALGVMAIGRSLFGSGAPTIG